MMKNKTESKFLRWLNGEDLLIDTKNEEPPVYDPDAADPYRYELEAHPLRKVDKAERRAFGWVYAVLSVLLVLFLSSVLLLTVSNLPRYGASDAPVNNEVSERYIESGLEETGATNLVAGMILDYRAFDTLGESHVLFTGICAVMILLLTGKEDKKKQLRYQAEEALYDVTGDPIVRIMAFFLMPCLLVFGIYVLLNGHLSPGGGFSGGAILGAAFILYSMAFGFEKTERFLNEKTIKVISCCSLGFYVVAKSYSFFTGANHLHSIISPGTPGAILSAGLIMPLNVAVGMVVACTMYSIFSFFKRGTV